MTCRAVDERLREFLAGELDAGARRRLEEHLAGCVACLRYLAGLRATIDALRRLGRALRTSSPEDRPASDALLEAIRSSRVPPVR